MLWNPGVERNYVNISFYYCFVFITFLLWFLLPHIIQVNMAIPHGDGVSHAFALMVCIQSMLI